MNKDEQILRENIKQFRIAKYIDAKYYDSYIYVKKKGVNILAYDCTLNSKEIKVNKKINIL